MVEGKSIDASHLLGAFSQLAESIDELKIIKLAGDASSRHYYRIAGQKKSWVLQVSEVFENSMTHPFLCGQKILKEIGARVPDVCGVVADKGWVLLDDLGDETLQFHPSLALYKEAIDLMLLWAKNAHPKSQSIDATLRSRAPHFSWAFDVEKLSFEMNFTTEHLFNKLLKRSEDFAALVAANTNYLAARPRVFCHRDYHSRNLMFHAGHLHVIDFQDARMGPITYDVVSLVWDPYVRLSEEWRTQLFLYWKELYQKEGLIKGTDTELVVELERMKIQRLMKAAGSYASFYNVKGRTDYLPHIVPAIADAMKAVSKLCELRKATVEDEKLLTLLQSIKEQIPDIIKKL